VKRCRLFIIISVLIAALVLGVRLWPRAPEPEYNGVALSTWLERSYDRQYHDEFPKATEHMGTNALPVLVRCVDYQMAGWKLWRWKIAQGLPAAIVAPRPVRSLLEDKALLKANAAIGAFAILGRRATPALNDLSRLERKHPMGFATEAIYNININSWDPDEPSVNLN
jgi:hypothetical protein